MAESSAYRKSIFKGLMPVWQYSSVGKDTCHYPWQPKFEPHNLHSRKNWLLQVFLCLPHIIPDIHMTLCVCLCINLKKIAISFLIGKIIFIFVSNPLNFWEKYSGPSHPPLFPSSSTSSTFFSFFLFLLLLPFFLQSLLFLLLCFSFFFLMFSFFPSLQLFFLSIWCRCVSLSLISPHIVDLGDCQQSPFCQGPW